MDESALFVYKSTMDKGVAIFEDYYESRSFMGIQIDLCSFCRLKQWEYNDLSAPFWRWYFNDKPGASVIINKKRIALTPDLVVLIPPHTVFAGRTDRIVGHLYIHFTLGLDRTPDPGRIYLHRPDAREKRLIRRLTSTMLDLPSGSQLEVSFLSLALVSIALTEVPVRDWEDRIPDSRIERALRSMKTRFPLAVSNTELALEARMNVNAFTRIFRQATGYAPHQYLLRLRIEKASQLLLHSSASLETISEQTGFCNRFHFSRIFKQQMQTSPACFRRASMKKTSK